MAETQKKSRKASRPRMDAVVRHIMAGSYDDELPILKGAIDARNQKRQEAVLGLVAEVFGDDYVVKPKGNPFIERAEAQGRQPNEVRPGESPHVLDPSAVSPASPDDKLDDDPDYESRSPMIGSIDDPLPAETEPTDDPSPA